MSTTTSNEQTFEIELRMTYQRLRSALMQAALEARGKPTFPQDLARHLNINKNLAWHVSRIIKSASPGDGIPHIPGSSGMKRFIQAASSAGASEHVVVQVMDAHKAYLDAVRVHAGDQETLELLLDGSLRPNTAESLATSRKMAFLGNSGLMGLQAKAKVTSCFMSPGQANPELLDTMLVGGFIDLCRLRPVSGNPLFRIRSFVEQGTPTGVDQPATVYMSKNGTLSPLDGLNESHLIVEKDERGKVYRLHPGPVGRTGSFTTYFNQAVDSVFNRYANQMETTGQFTSIIEVPVEALLFDLFIHKDLGYNRDLRFDVISRTSGGLDDDLNAKAHDILPIKITPERLEGGSLTCATELCPHYPDLLHLALSQRPPLEDYTCHRYVVPHPPMHSTIRIAFPLDEKPA